MAHPLKKNLYTIYVGDRSDPFFPSEYHKAHDAFEGIQKKLGATQLTFVKQVHGTDVVCIEKTQQHRSLFVHEQTGDALITQEPGCAIGVLTADCLPVVLYDEKNHVIAVVHAGWRGSVAQILPKTVAVMKKRFCSSPHDIDAFFAPSAGVCCYEVGDDFCDNVKDASEQVLVRKDHKLFFNNVKYNCLQLLAVGILQKNIKTLSFSGGCNPSTGGFNPLAGGQKAACTICNKAYHSYRRDGVNSGRQATVAVLS